MINFNHFFIQLATEVKTPTDPDNISEEIPPNLQTNLLEIWFEF
jgi:hypothetical protein